RSFDSITSPLHVSKSQKHVSTIGSSSSSSASSQKHVSINDSASSSQKHVSINDSASSQKHVSINDSASFQKHVSINDSASSQKHVSINDSVNSQERTSADDSNQSQDLASTTDSIPPPKHVSTNESAPAQAPPIAISADPIRRFHSRSQSDATALKTGFSSIKHTESSKRSFLSKIKKGLATTDHPPSSSSDSFYSQSNESLHSSSFKFPSSGSPIPTPPAHSRSPDLRKGHPAIEDKLIKDLSRCIIECPICFLYYPKNINYSSCCHQPICSECFIQFKRTEHNPNPVEYVFFTTTTITTPSSSFYLSSFFFFFEPYPNFFLFLFFFRCPFCLAANFGIYYSPPSVTMPNPGFKKHTARGKSVSHIVPPSIKNVQSGGHKRSYSTHPHSQSKVSCDDIRPNMVKQIERMKKEQNDLIRRRELIVTSLGQVPLTSTPILAVAPNQLNPSSTSNPAGVPAQNVRVTERGRELLREYRQGGGMSLDDFLLQEAITLSRESFMLQNISGMIEPAESPATQPLENSNPIS
ncbi:Protein sip5, partial [Smittium mucronatum]